MTERILFSKIDLLHTTEMGVERIRKNLKIDANDVVEYCKKKILDKKCTVCRRGKNWYCEIDDIIITVNSHSYTIITAHKLKK